jgi:ketosteroid isomerase-like protein
MSAGMSRRSLVNLGAGVFGGAALAPEIAGAQTSHAPVQRSVASRNEALVRRYYKLWEIKDWAPFDAMLADDFTFSSPQDDRISKAVFKKKCFESQVGFIKSFDLETVMAKGDQVIVEYLLHTQNGKELRNVELHRLHRGKIESIDCYFGGPASFPSAVSAKKT